MTEAKMKTAAEILNELSKITFRFDVFPATEPPTRCGQSCWLRPGDPMVWREQEHPPAKNAPKRSGFGMCIACGKVALEKHYALVLDVGGRAERETRTQGPGNCGAPACVCHSVRRQILEGVESSPSQIAKRVLDGKFWETGSGQVAIASVDEEADGSIVIHAVMVGGPGSTLRLGLGQEPEHFGWRVAEHFTAEEVAEKLGLEPFDDFARRQGRGRGSGRTLKMMCQAISLASRGYWPRVLVHHEGFAMPFRTWLSGLTETFGPCVKRITLHSDRASWSRGTCLMRDHHVEWNGAEHAG